MGNCLSQTSSVLGLPFTVNYVYDNANRLISGIMDTATGSFLTSDAKPDSSNPYIPWEPTGGIIGFLGVAALFFGEGNRSANNGLI